MVDQLEPQPAQNGSSPPTEFPVTILDETIESRKARIDNLWSAWNDIQEIPELVSLFDRKNPLDSDQTPVLLLQAHNYPQRTHIRDVQFENWRIQLNPRFIKDGYMYLLRGDHPDLEKKGFYTRTYGYGRKTTQQLTQDLTSSQDVGYLLYGEDAYLTDVKPNSTSIAQELAFNQSQRGGSSFISTTTNVECARAGTGNNPDPTEQAKYQIYIVKIPIDDAINSNTNNSFGLEENEVLVSDYISPEEIIATFHRDQTEEIYTYLRTLIGVTQEDLGMSINSH